VSREGAAEAPGKAPPAQGGVPAIGSANVCAPSGSLAGVVHRDLAFGGAGHANQLHLGHLAAAGDAGTFRDVSLPGQVLPLLLALRA
jgi:hypothetical protein